MRAFTKGKWEKLREKIEAIFCIYGLKQTLRSRKLSVTSCSSNCSQALKKNREEKKLEKKIVKKKKEKYFQDFEVKTNWRK